MESILYTFFTSIVFVFILGNNVLATTIKLNQNWKFKAGDNNAWADPAYNDSGWQAGRNASGEIISNERFPNIQAMIDSIHAMGLKFGIYSSPGPLTCGGFTGSYQHELQDAKTYSKWGVDFLKYDWCSYSTIAVNNSLPELMKPYSLMQKSLMSTNRDIVYSLCQYGMGNVWKWGAEVNGNLWRTTGDITDHWEVVCALGFAETDDAKYAGPGHWNDPDMLTLGWVGWGIQKRPVRLTFNEQYSHFSLWCLLSAPLLAGSDMTRLDDFTLNLFTNDEVIAINQDPLGKQATRVYSSEKIQVWMKDLEDGSKAVGIFNFGTNVSNHGVALLKLTAK
jgi:alpha-galactosidase